MDARQDLGSLLRTFAAAPLFRSASVEELELDDDFYRRPLRPEDLEFIDFTMPVASDTICDLASLAAHRALRCIYDLQVARMPRSSSNEVWMRRAEFYSDANRIVAARLTPLLEQFAFGFLERPPRSACEATRAKLCADFEMVLCEALTFARGVHTRFLNDDPARGNLRLVLVQKWSLGETKHGAIARAEASGFFDLLPQENRPQIGSGCGGTPALALLAPTIEIDRSSHTFWQFYLPTSLAEANLLSALAGRPERSLELLGAGFVAEADWLGSVWMAQQVCEDMGLIGLGAERMSDLDSAASATTSRFVRALGAVEKALGGAGLDEVGRGLDTAARLARLARSDLEAQLRWLVCLDEYVGLARRLDHRIRTHGQAIDRETFVEPREMCSTTHVHDDHRLVVIESGQMVFWARPRMCLRLAPGDMILVPRGRLHGSSVTSDECVYHQPIIPEDWVRPLVEEVDGARGWLS